MFTWENHLHQVSLQDVAGIFNQLEDVVCRRVVFEQKNLVVDAVEAALWELEDKTKNKAERQKCEKGKLTQETRFVALK